MAEDMKTQLSVEKAYEEVGTNYRYFLNWRRYMVTGWFAVMGAMAVAFSWVHKNAETYSWVLFIAALIVTFAFWVMDYRDRDLYHACQKAGDELEKNHSNIQGVYTKLNNLGSRCLTHSRALDILYFTTIAGMFGGVIWSFYKCA